MWMDEDSRVDGQPMGFATPQAVPLGAYTSATLSAISDAPMAPPQAFAVSGDPGPRLDAIAPAPPERRDPSQPFEAGQGDQMPDSVARDPREPIVTTSFSGTGPDFAPPTGEPVDKWAPPAGPPVPWGAPIQSWQPERGVGAIARSGAGYPPYQPAMPPTVTYRGPSVGKQSPIQDRYDAAYDGLAKLGVVMAAVPWFVLVILFVAVLPIGNWSVLLLMVAWIACTSQAKVAQPRLNGSFAAVAVLTTLSWVVGAMTHNYALADAYITIVRWCCAILIVVLPLLVWRALERRH